MHGESAPSGKGPDRQPGSSWNGTSSRRSFLAATGAAALGGIAGCLGGDGGSDEPLRVTAWSGPFEERFREGFAESYEEEYGTEVEVIPEWSEVLSNIRAAPEDDPPYDVTIVDGWFYWEGRQDDLFLEVDYDEITNWNEVYEYIQEFRDHTYGVPIEGQSTSIVYIEDEYEEPETWADFADMDGLAMEGGFPIYPLQVGAVLAGELPGDGELYESQYHDDVIDSLAALDVTEWYSSGADIWEAMDQGLASAAQYYGFMTAYNADEDRNIGLDVVVPEETGGFWDSWCIVRGTDKEEEAHRFLNHLLDADVQAGFAEISGEMLANKNVGQPDWKKGLVPPTSEQLENVYLPDWKSLDEYYGDLQDGFDQAVRD